MSDRLQQIVSQVRQRLDLRQKEIPLAELAELASRQDPPRSLAMALRRPAKGTNTASAVRVIGELKRRSPSAGSINLDLDPADGARRLTRVGCSAISVLTEPDFFGGSLETLREARRATELPLLRKDFIVEPYQLLEARAHGADAVLLLAAVLTDELLLAFRDRADELGLEVLVEAHGLAELERILQLDLKIVGCNARDLSTFEVDLGKALEWCSRVPSERVCVVESGVMRAEDGARVTASAVDATLIGEGLMREGRIEENFREIFGGADD